MASIFHQQYTAYQNGKTIRKKSKYWYIDYKGPGGIRKRVRGFKDKQATVQYAAQLEKESEQMQAVYLKTYHAKILKIYADNKGLPSRLHFLRAHYWHRSIQGVEYLTKCLPQE